MRRRAPSLALRALCPEQRPTKGLALRHDRHARPHLARVRARARVRIRDRVRVRVGAWVTARVRVRVRVS